jgi:hypothetical protein
MFCICISILGVSFAPWMYENVKQERLEGKLGRSICILDYGFLVIWDGFLREEV